MATDLELTDVEPEALPFEPEGLYEVIDGRVVEKCMGAYEVDIANLIDDLLAEFVKPGGLGRVHVEMLFLIDPARNLKRRPDVAFVSRERWPIGRRAPRQEAWDVVPDLAIEVVSPTNSALEVVEKIEDYLRAGVRLVWIVYPIQGVVHAFGVPGAPHIYRRGDDLDGGDVLPGFRLPLATLFEDEPESTPTPA